MEAAKLQNSFLYQEQLMCVSSIKKKRLNIVISEYFGFKHIYATSANKVYTYLYSNNER